MQVAVKFACLAFSALVIFPGARLVAAQGFSPRKEVVAQNARLSESVSKNDPVSIGTLYSKDAEALPPGAEPVRGRPAVVNMWQSLLDKGVRVFEAKTGDADLKDGVITESGTFLMKTKDGKVYSRGAYQNAWKKEDGQWRIQRSAWTPDQ